MTENQWLKHRAGENRRDTVRQRGSWSGRQVCFFLASFLLMDCFSASLNSLIPASPKFSLVGQIAKHAFKCTVIGSCRSRKCFPSSAAFLRIYNNSVSKSKDFSFFKSSHGFVADATLYEHWGLTQLLITHSTLQAQMPSKSSDPS